MEDSFDNLTLLEKAFCEEYVLDCNAKQAAIRSGFQITREHASRLVKGGKMLPYIEYLRKNAAEMAGVTIIRNAKELANIAYPTVDDEGINQYIAKPMDRLKAIEILNKMFGFNEAEKSTVTVDNLSNRSDAELAAMIEEKRRQRNALSE